MQRYFYALAISFTLLLSGCLSESKNDTPQSFTLRAADTSPVVSISQNIVLISSAPLAVESVNAESVALLDANGTAVDVLLSVDATNKKITLSPYAYLHPSSSYSVKVDTSVSDIEGRHLSQEYTYSFSTLSEPLDTTALQVRALNPPDGYPQVLTEADIVVDFNKNLAMLPPQTPASEYFSIQDANGTEIGGTLKVFNSMLVFTPTAPLQPGTLYSVELQKNLKDMYGNESDTVGLNWSFTTASQQTQQSSRVLIDSLQSFSGVKKVQVLRNPKPQDIYSNRYYTMVALFYETKMQLYKVYYGPEDKPAWGHPSIVLLYEEAYSDAKFRDVVMMQEEYFIVAFEDGSLKVYRTDENGMVLASSVEGSGENIYRLRVGLGNTLFVVGPNYGLAAYTLYNEELLLKYHEYNASKSYLDVADFNDTLTGETKVFVADYTGGVDMYDFNGTFLGRSDINGSVKFLSRNVDYNGFAESLSVLSASGKLNRMLPDGTLDTESQGVLPFSAQNMLGFLNKAVAQNSGLAVGYGDRGIVFTDYLFPQSVLKPGFYVSGYDLLENPLTGDGYILVCGDEGSVHLYNTSPSFEISLFPVSNPINPDDYFRLYSFANYMDYTDIADAFVVTDMNDSTQISVQVEAVYDYTFGAMVINLLPEQNLTSGHDYNVSFGDLKNMLGDTPQSYGSFAVFSVN